jgi:hypothetical protein
MTVVPLKFRAEYSARAGARQVASDERDGEGGLSGYRSHWLANVGSLTTAKDDSKLTLLKSACLGFASRLRCWLHSIRRGSRFYSLTALTRPCIRGALGSAGPVAL